MPDDAEIQPQTPTADQPTEPDAQTDVVTSDDVTTDAPLDSTAAPDDAPPELSYEEQRKIDIDAAIDEAREAWDVDTNRRIKTERDNAVRKREGELRRQAGSNQHVRETMRQVAVALQDANDGTLDQAIEQAAQLVVQRNLDYGLNGLFEEFPNALMTKYDLPVTVREAALEARQSGDSDASDRYVTTLIEGAVEQGHADRLVDLKPADLPEKTALWENLTLERVPKTSALWKDVEAWVAREIAAANQERVDPGETPPATKGGGAPPTAPKHDTNTLIGIMRAKRAGTLTAEEALKRYREVAGVG